MIFPVVLATIFIAEMGDKTQLLLLAMTGKYKVRDILIGTWAATIVLNLLAVAAGAALSSYLDMRVIKTVAALAFFFFSWSTLKDDGDGEEEDVKENRGKAAILAVFGTFFIGELGDKTQLSAITMAATYTDHSLLNAFYVFLGCTLGLILADLIGLLAGLFFKSKLPTRVLNLMSFVIFALFGALNMREAAGYIFGEGTLPCLLLWTGAAAAFVLLCVFTVLSGKKKEE